MSANNTVGGIPATIIFTLIISFFAFFAAVTCVTLYYYKRDPRRLQRLRQIEEAEARDSITFGAWEEAPAIWEVWADKHPKPTSEWEGLLPLNLTYFHDQPPPHASPLPQSLALLSAPGGSGGWTGLSGGTSTHPRPPESNRLQPKPVADDCKVSVFIAMPTPHRHLPPEFGNDFVIGTAGISYHHPGHPQP